MCLKKFSLVVIYCNAIKSKHKLCKIVFEFREVLELTLQCSFQGRILKKKKKKLMKLWVLNSPTVRNRK
jgi:hypothetical protein